RGVMRSHLRFETVSPPQSSLSIWTLRGDQFLRWLFERDVLAMTWCVACDARYFAVRTCAWCGAACTPVGPVAARQITRAWRRDPALVSRIKAEWVERCQLSRPGVDPATIRAEESVTPLRELPWRDALFQALPWLPDAWRAAHRPAGRPVDLTRRY